MSGLSDFAQNKITDAIFRAQALGAPATLYFAMCKSTKGPRANSTVYALNDTININVGGEMRLYKATTAGTTAAAQPGGYVGARGEAITDGTAVFTEQSAAMDAGTAVVEPSGGSYARQGVTASLANFAGTQSAGSTTASSGTSGVTSNNAAITWATAPTADWVSGSEKIWAVAVYDASSAGNLWAWAPLSTLQSVLNGQAAPSIATAAFTNTIGA